MDVILDNIITEVIDWDKADDFEKTSQPKGLHLQKLVREIRSCGVGFVVWEIRNPADNKGTGKYDFTSLFGSDKKKVLALLPEKLSTFLHQNTCTEVTKVWVDFRSIYNEINTWSHDKSTETFWNKTKKWLQTFVSL